MNEGIHLDLDTWIVPGQIRTANLCQGLGNRYTPAGTEVLISADQGIKPKQISVLLSGQYSQKKNLREKRNLIKVFFLLGLP